MLDLYAGSGAVGLEAVSRGAASAVLVDRETRSLAKTVARLGGGARKTRVIRGEAEPALRELERQRERFDLIFCDPPYREVVFGGFGALVARLLAPEGELILQRDGRSEPPALAEVLLCRHRAYGRNVFYFFKARREMTF